MFCIINLSFHFKKGIKIIKYLCIALYCRSHPERSVAVPPLSALSWIITFIRIFLSLAENEIKICCLTLETFAFKRKVFSLALLENFPPEKIFEMREGKANEVVNKKLRS